MSITIHASEKRTHPEFGECVYPVDGSPELNVANGNFGAICRMLRINCEPCGEIDAGELMNKIEAAIPEMCERPHSEQSGGGHAHLIDFGLNSEQVDRYVQALSNIAFFAFENGNFISWS